MKLLWPAGASRATPLVGRGGAVLATPPLRHTIHARALRCVLSLYTTHTRVSLHVSAHTLGVGGIDFWPSTTVPARTLGVGATGCKVPLFLHRRGGREPQIACPTVSAQTLEVKRPSLFQSCCLGTDAGGRLYGPYNPVVSAQTSGVGTICCMTLLSRHGR